jgi:endonuclease YncB( thermonuclease family)
VRRLPLWTALLLAVSLGSPPATANAASGACVVGEVGPLCQVWTGRVISVNDGDTMDVDIAGDGTRATRRIRMVGVQAMEQRVFSARYRQGDCHAVAATLRLEQLLNRGRRIVRLAAEDPWSTSHNRLRRLVAVKIGGRWRDVGTKLVGEGHALWWPTWSESAANRRYSIRSQRALAAARGVFDPDGCGPGPAAASPLALTVNWDADGNDAWNPSGEWVEIANLDPVNPVALGGWHLRDATLSRYTFPPHAVIPPGGRVTVNVGREGDQQTVFSWARRAAKFENASHDEDAMGDGAYLFDTLGNVRAAMIYPCRTACSDPLEGLLAVTADPTGERESIAVSNLTGGPVSLDGYLLKRRPYSYHFGPDAVVPPGESLRVMIQGDREDDTPLRKHWGLERQLLHDDGDQVLLNTYTDLVVACAAWGGRSC